MNTTEKQIKKLYESKDNATACDAIYGLKKIVMNNKATEDERRKIIEALMSHANSYDNISASSAVAVMVDLVQEKEAEYADFFRACMESGNNSRCYWGINGYAKVMAKDSYEYLTGYIFSQKVTLEHKALIVKAISKLSKNPFDWNKPYECREWKEADIEYDAIRTWSENGFPDGNGYEEPVCHECLQNPESKEEKIYVRLDKKLLKKREKKQDLAHPSNWLVKAEQADLECISKKWNLPKFYLDFLEKASPLAADFKIKGYGSVDVYGAHELIKGQEGYSYNPCTNKNIENWNSDYVVIANHFGDPFCIDISQENSPVYFAYHGQGAWEFSEEFGTFLDFLKSLN